MHLVVELSGGRHFPRSQSVGFAVQCQLIGQQRISCVSRGTDAPFWGDLFSWELSGALLRQLQASTPSLKLQVVMIKGEGVGRIEQPLGHVVVSLKGVQHALPVQAWHALKPSGGGHALFGSLRHTRPPEISILIRLLTDAPRLAPSLAVPPGASGAAGRLGLDAAHACAAWVGEGGTRSEDAPEPAAVGGASASPPPATAPIAPSVLKSALLSGDTEDTEGGCSSSAEGGLGSGAGPLFLSQRQRAELGVRGSGVCGADEGESGEEGGSGEGREHGERKRLGERAESEEEGAHGERGGSGSQCAASPAPASSPLFPSQAEGSQIPSHQPAGPAAAEAPATAAAGASPPADAARDVPELPSIPVPGASQVQSISKPGAAPSPDGILSSPLANEAGAESSLETAAVAPPEDPTAIGQVASASTSPLGAAAAQGCDAAAPHAAESTPLPEQPHTPPPPPPPPPPPSPPAAQCELLVHFRMPPAESLASLLRVSPATSASVVPRLRWLGTEVGSLSSDVGSWRMSVLLSGHVDSVLHRMMSEGAEPPLLCLHAAALDAPLALACLPVGMLRPTAEGAYLDETIELFKPESSGEGLTEPSAQEAVRLGVTMRLRPRDVATATEREEDPRVCFSVRVRLLSLTLLRAPECGTQPVSYTGEGYGDAGGKSEGWCALRLSAYAGCPAQTAPAVRWLAGHPSDLCGEELTLPLPNPPFTPRAALQRLRAQPLALELLCGPSRFSVEADPHPHAVASLCFEDVCGGALTALPQGPDAPHGQAAAATDPVSRAVELLDRGGETVGRAQLQLTLQCVYSTGEAGTEAPSSQAAALGPRAGLPGAGRVASVAQTDAPPGRHSFRFSISVRSARDLSLPLGGYANVYCRFAYRLLELQEDDAGGGSSRAVRSSPPMLLPKRGEVALPNGGCVFEFACEPSSLLQTLAHQPLLIELWHKDRYASDVLLGIGTVDTAEIVGVLPRASGVAPSGFVTTERAEELAVPVRPPVHMPAPLRRSADPNGGGSGRHGKASAVAMLRVGLRLEELGPATPAIGLGRQRHAPVAPADAPPLADGAGPAEAALLKWRQREEVRWRSALKRREEELLAELSREWAARESHREQALAQQRRVLSAVEAELKLKLNEVTEQQKMLRAAEGELAARGAAIEQKSAFDQATLQSAALREQAHMQGELAASRASLGQAQAKVAMLEERLVAAEAREQRHEEAAVKMSDATANSAAKALSLQAEVARLGAMLQEVRGKHEAAVSTAEQRKQQALSAHRELHRLQEDVRVREEQRLRDQIVAERHAHEQAQLRAQADHEHLALAGEASELRRLQVQLAKIEAEHTREQHYGQGAASRGGQPAGPRVGRRLAGARSAVAAPAADESEPEDAVAAEEVARLQGMCDDFVRSGMYAQGDRVLLLLQQRIGELTGQPA